MGSDTQPHAGTDRDTDTLLQVAMVERAKCFTSLVILHENHADNALCRSATHFFHVRVGTQAIF